MKDTVTVWLSPGSRVPVGGSSEKGSFTFQAYAHSRSPLFVSTNALATFSFTAQYPNSIDGGTASDTTGSFARTGTKKLLEPFFRLTESPAPCGMLTNSMKSSYCSMRTGLKVMVTVCDMPGDRLIVSGNSMLKYLVAGS